MAHSDRWTFVNPAVTGKSEYRSLGKSGHLLCPFVVIASVDRDRIRQVVDVGTIFTVTLPTEGESGGS